MSESSAVAMSTEYVEVCFPAWPERRCVAIPVTTVGLDRLIDGPVEVATLVAAAALVPGAVAALSVLVLAFLVAFALLGPVLLVLLAWSAWRHDGRLDGASRAEAHRLA